MSEFLKSWKRIHNKYGHTIFLLSTENYFEVESKKVCYLSYGRGTKKHKDYFVCEFKVWKRNTINIWLTHTNVEYFEKDPRDKKILHSSWECY